MEVVEYPYLVAKDTVTSWTVVEYIYKERSKRDLGLLREIHESPSFFNYFLLMIIFVLVVYYPYEKCFLFFK